MPSDDSLSVLPAAETDRAAWDGFVLGPARGCVLQTWGWGELRRRYGWTVDRLCALDAEGRVAGVMQLQSRTGRLPLGLAYAPRGPAIGDVGRDGRVALGLIDAARGLARRRRALLLKLDPEWPRDEPATAAVLAAAGARASWYDVQHRSTYLVDLDGGADAVLSRVKSSTRHHIRRAERDGVEVTLSSDAGVAVCDFHPLFVETADRNRIVAREAGYYGSVVDCLAGSCPVAVLVARVAGEPAAAMIAVAAGPRLVYLFGASAPRLAHSHPAYLLHWKAILWGIDHGCTIYDMWGVPPHEDPSAPGAGYFEFKTRWNGRIARHIRCQEIRPWPLFGPLPRLAERIALRGRPLLS